MMNKDLYICLLKKLIHYTEEETKAINEDDKNIFGCKQQAILECLIEGVNFYEGKK